MDCQYTNQLTPEVLTELERIPDILHHWTETDTKTRILLVEQQKYRLSYPINAIYRLAVAGCLTRYGGIGDEYNSSPEGGYKIRLENGQWASVLTEGCRITYPNGRTARIITSPAFGVRAVMMLGKSRSRIPISLKWLFIRSLLR